MAIFDTKNCICIQCGTTKQNSDTGKCEHNHDDWLEYSDFIDQNCYIRVERAMKHLNMPEKELRKIVFKDYFLV